MAQRVFSKMLPTARGGGRSFYEELRGRDHNESRAGLLDEENLNENFQDYDLEHAGLGVEDSRATVAGMRSPASKARGPRGAPTVWPTHEDDGDNDVPASLLVEPHEGHASRGPEQPRKKQAGFQPGSAIPGPSRARAQWDTTQAHQRLHNDDFAEQHGQRANNAPNFFAGVISGSVKKRAEWRWANVSNLDIFMKDVYDYYVGAGLWCILTERVLHLAYVTSFSDR